MYKNFNFIFGVISVVLIAGSCATVPQEPSESEKPVIEEQEQATPAPEIPPVLRQEDFTDQKFQGEAYNHFFNGVYYEHNQQFEKAIDEYNECLKLSPGSAYTAVKIAVLYETLARSKQDRTYFEKSLEYVEKAIAIDPDYLPAYRQQANLYSMVDPVKALGSFQKIIELNPEEKDVLYDIGRLLLVTEKPGKAAAYLEQYLDETTDPFYRMEATYNLMIYYSYEDKFYELIRCLDRLGAQSSDSFMAIAELVNYLNDRQPALYKKFQEFLDQELIIQRVPVAQYKTLLAIASVTKTDKLIDPVFQNLMTNYPDDPDLVVNYARFLFWDTQPPVTAKAMGLLQNAINNGTANRDTYFYLGIFHQELSQYEQALGIFNDGFDLYPEDEEFLFQMAVSYEKMGDFTNTIQKLKETIQFNPEHAEALNYLAYVYAEKGIHLEEALNHVQIALSMKQNSAAMIDTLGWVYYKMGRYMDAVKELEKAVQLMETPEPVILDHLGDAYFQVGSRNLAIKRWKESLELDPNNQKLKQKILDTESGKHVPINSSP